MNDILRAMSISLALGELLSLVPHYVDSLVICGPSIMRLIPWHLLTIEVPALEDDNPSPNNLRGTDLKTTHPQEDELIGVVDEDLSAAVSKLPPTVEILVVERYSTRLGPSLTLFELSTLGASRIVSQNDFADQEVLCTIDGAIKGEGAGHSLIDAPMTDLDVELSSAAGIWTSYSSSSGALDAPEAVPLKGEDVFRGKTKTPNGTEKGRRRKPRPKREPPAAHDKRRKREQAGDEDSDKELKKTTKTKPQADTSVLAVASALLTGSNTNSKPRSKGLRNDGAAKFDFING
jgi:hypothetical protein